MNRYEQQKQLSRRLILDAAMTTFSALGYHAANVEDIITRAKVSRATFYKHFKSKLAVAEALSDWMSEDQEDAYDRLSLAERPDYTSIVVWLKAIIEIFERNKLLLSVLADLYMAEPRLRETVAVADTNRIRKLSKSIPAFLGALAAPAGRSEARDRVQLLLFQVDSVLFRMAVRGWDMNREVAVDFLARQILNFIEDASSERTAKAAGRKLLPDAGAAASLRRRKAQ